MPRSGISKKSEFNEAAKVVNHESPITTNRGNYRMSVAIERISIVYICGGMVHKIYREKVTKGRN